jgi:AbrB family looped-hinge helix DNA binding protein
MSTLLVSSKGQIVLPADLRRRLGMGAGARIEVLEEPDGLKLRVVRPVAPVTRLEPRLMPRDSTAAA